MFFYFFAWITVTMLSDCYYLGLYKHIYQQQHDAIHPDFSCQDIGQTSCVSKYPGPKNTWAVKATSGIGECSKKTY